MHPLEKVFAILKKKPCLAAKGTIIDPIIKSYGLFLEWLYQFSEELKEQAGWSDTSGNSGMDPRSSQKQWLSPMAAGWKQPWMYEAILWAVIGPVS